MRRGRDFADGELECANVSSRDERGRDPDPELDIPMARLIGRVAIHENVLAVQLNPAAPGRVDLIQMALEFQRDTRWGKASMYRRDGSRRGTLKRHGIAGRGRHVLPQLTALFTSAPILTSPAAVNSFSAKAVGHMSPSSRCALSLKPSVE